MRVAAAQLNPIVGDLEGNAAKVVTAAREAARAAAELVAMPELVVTGYPPLDLLDEPDFVERALRAADDLVVELGREVPGTAVVFGTIGINESATGRRLTNLAVLARDGRRLAARAKSLLPTYDVFDEDRWFEPAAEVAPVDLDGASLGLTVCEDIWADADYWPRPRHARDPVTELASAGYDLLVNVSASPYHRGKPVAREHMMAATARRHGRPLLFANQVGANDELIFDGSSVVLDAAGRALARGPAFEEALVVADMPGADRSEGDASNVPASAGSAAELRDALVLGLRDYVRKTGFTGVVLGLSGGIDSAVTAALAADALGAEAVEGVLMPSRFSSAGSVDDSLELAKRLGIRTTTIPIEPVHAAFLEILADRFEGLPTDVTEENLQARIRGVILMALSNKLGRLVLSTGNKSELAVGYTTLYGDMTGGLAVIGDCYKTWVRELAEAFRGDEARIPRAILDKPPTAELRPDQLDTDSLPPYPLLDRILEGLIEDRRTVAELVASGLPEDVVRSVRGQLERSEYKRRQAPPILRVTRRAFGQGRRLPLARA